MSESNFDKVMRIGREILLREDAESLSVDIAEDAVNAATAEMEKAAMDGDEAAYLKAKEKRADAQTKYEMLKIRGKNRSELVPMSEATHILSPYVNEAISNMADEFEGFLHTYDDMCAKVERIITAGDRYNSVMSFWRNHVMKVDKLPFASFMAELFPVAIVVQMKNRSAYERQRIQEAVDRHRNK